MNQDERNNAVIYCPDASTSQSAKGMTSQEERSREYAKTEGYEVTEVFRDQGVSGPETSHPAITAMVKYLHQHQDSNFVVIIDDISRLVRDFVTHISLREAIESTSASLESPALDFDNNADSKFMEHMMAIVAQYEDEKEKAEI